MVSDQGISCALVSDYLGVAAFLDGQLTEVLFLAVFIFLLQYQSSRFESYLRAGF